MTDIETLYHDIQSIRSQLFYNKNDALDCSDYIAVMSWDAKIDFLDDDILPAIERLLENE